MVRNLRKPGVGRHGVSVFSGGVNPSGNWGKNYPIFQKRIGKGVLCALRGETKARKVRNEEGGQHYRAGIGINGRNSD